MDRTALSQLKALVSPMALSGALTLEQASSAMRFNEGVAQFHRALAYAERSLDRDGLLDGRLERELLDRAAQLAALRARVAPAPAERSGAALVPA